MPLYLPVCLSACPQTRLWFAGEATSKEDAYTVHGAFETGGWMGGAMEGGAMGVRCVCNQFTAAVSHNAPLSNRTLPPRPPASVGKYQAIRIRKWWRMHHAEVQRLRQQQLEGEREQLGGAAAAAVAGGGRPASAAARRKVAATLAAP